MTEYFIELTESEIDKLCFYDASSYRLERPLPIQPPSNEHQLREYALRNKKGRLEKAFRWVNPFERPSADDLFFSTGYGSVGDVLVHTLPKLYKPIRLEVLAIDIYKPPQADKYVIGLLVKRL